MVAILIILILMGVVVVWFAAPAIGSVIELKRRNAQVRAITRQTVRDMNRVTKPKDRLW